MDLYELPFGKIILLREDIAEVLIDEGVEMNQAKVEQYHEFLLSYLRIPFLLLVNKVSSYTYDFKAQQQLATLKEINAIAVVVCNRMTKISTESLAQFPRDVKWDLKKFSNRKEALVWLISIQESSE